MKVWALHGKPFSADKTDNHSVRTTTTNNKNKIKLKRNPVGQGHHCNDEEASTLQNHEIRELC